MVHSYVLMFIRVLYCEKFEGNSAKSNSYFVSDILATMVVYCFFIVLLIAVVMYATDTFDASKNTTSQYTLCATDECINAASEILANLNRTVDPCDDFYKFACGGWIQKNQVNKSFPHVVSFTELAKRTEKQLREILEEPVKPNDTVSLLKAKRIFAQCMDNGNSVAGESVNISAIIQRYTGWPLGMSHREWEDGNVTWQNVSITLLESGFENGLFDITVMADFKMTNTNVITIGEPPFFLVTGNMIQSNKNISSRVDMYKSSIESIARNLTEENGGTMEIDNITRDTLDVVIFETELANLRDPDINNVDVDTFYVPRTIQQFQEDYDKQHPGKNGKIDWHMTIQRVFASEGIAIEPSEKLVVVGYKYLTNLVSVLERTSSYTIFNYMQWALFKKLSPYIKSKADFTARVIMHIDSAQQQKSNDRRWKICLQELNLKSAISHEYVKKYASKVNIQAIREISTDVKDAVRDQIRKATWMDETTREASLEKLARMRHELFKPDWYSDEAIDRYYEGLNVSMRYLENMINIFKFERKKTLSSLRTPVDKTQWLQEPTEPGAYFSHNNNKLVVNAAILQNPVYNISRLPCMNYGSLGFIIGHEINHGFDNMGRKYDKNGNAIQWWTQESIGAYENVTLCFIDQYNEYLVPELEDNIHVNGQLTLPENIGDSAGIISAYYAYKNRQARLNETELRVQGLEEYSDDQIFFMTFAQTLCANTIPTIPTVLKQFIVDVHPIHEIRVRGSVSNLRQFSEVYNCPTGKPMNPEKKCALW